MSGFWDSEVGAITGKPEDAFAKTFTTIPDNTAALAKIEKFSVAVFNDKSLNAGETYFSIDWKITEGDFKNAMVNQKLRVCELDKQKRHRALNMLALLYQTFGVKRTHENMPDDKDLMKFQGMIAGIRIRETEPNQEGKTFNWVSEVHKKEGFVSETGTKLVVTHTNKDAGSAFDRNPRGTADNFGAVEDDIPF